MTVPAKGRRTTGLRWLALLLFASVGLGPANVAGAASPQADAASPPSLQGEATLLEGIADYFNQKVGEVTPEELKALRAEGYGIGEIVMAYGLAFAASLVTDEQQETSSTFDEALTRVLRLRQAGLGWGEIAKELGVHPSTLGQSVADALREAERKADELHEAARRAGAQAAPKLRQLGDDLRRAATSAAESARELLPEPAREHFRRALDELRKGLAAAAGGSDGGTGNAGAETGKAAGSPPGSAGQGPGSAAMGEKHGPGEGQSPANEEKAGGHEPGPQGPGSKGGKGSG